MIEPVSNDIPVELEAYHRQHQRRARIGLGIAGLGIAAALISGSGFLNHAKFTEAPPYSPALQSALTSLDGVLVDSGELLLAGSLIGLGGAMYLSDKNRSIDSAVSQSAESLALPAKSSRSSCASAVVKLGLSASIIVGVGVGALSVGIGNEITNGPDRPINALSDRADASTFVVQYPEAMPMLESDVDRKVGDEIVKIANKYGIRAVPIALLLSTTDYKGHELTSLTIGINDSHDPNLQQNTIDGREPVYIDEAAKLDLQKGAEVSVNGVRTVIVGKTHGSSAINRIGITTSEQIVDEVMRGDPEHAYHAIGIDTDPKTAANIVKEAESQLPPSPPNISSKHPVAISKEQYINNSEKFWKQNSKSITSVLELLSLNITLASVSALIGIGILRNVRELSTALATGTKEKVLQLGELLRALRTGITSSVAGIVTAAAISPIVNMSTSALRVGIGFREAMAGFGIGIGASLIGGISKVFHLKSKIDPKEHTGV